MKSVVARFQGFPDLPTFRANREPLRITTRYPDLAAERDNRSTHHHRFGQLVLRHIVREALVIALLNAVVGAFLGTLVDNCLGAGGWLLTHVGQSRQSPHLSCRPELTSS
jgi:hypothetical protein